MAAPVAACRMASTALREADFAALFGINRMSFPRSAMSGNLPSKIPFTSTEISAGLPISARGFPYDLRRLAPRPCRVPQPGRVPEQRKLMGGWKLEAARFFHISDDIDNLCVRNRDDIVRFDPDILEGSRSEIRSSSDNVSRTRTGPRINARARDRDLAPFCSRVTITREPASGFTPPASEITSTSRLGPERL